MSLLIARVGVYQKPTDYTRKRFQELFHTSIQPFWCVLTGFKICEFDEWLKTPDGTSTADYLTERYSPEARDFIRKLIQAETD